jgi:hypothetical protein
MSLFATDNKPNTLFFSPQKSDFREILENSRGARHETPARPAELKISGGEIKITTADDEELVITSVKKSDRDRLSATGFSEQPRNSFYGKPQAHSPFQKITRNHSKISQNSFRPIKKILFSNLIPSRHPFPQIKISP